jgi:integrase
MLAFFGDCELRSIDSDRAEAWLAWERKQGYADATIGRDLKRARQLFRRAVRKGIVRANPFEEIKGLKDTNDAKNEYVPRETVAACIKVAPDYEWRLILGLSRYAALRCPSEHQALKWADVDWEQRRFTLDSPKTGPRVIPIDPDLMPLLRDAFDAAEEGAVHVIAKHRGENPRTEMTRIIKRAGFKPWQRLFHNLRASCERDWSDRFPMPTVCAWTGHDAKTAQRYYLKTVADEHYQAASRGEELSTSQVESGAETVQCGAETVQKCDADSRNGSQEPIDNQGFT